MNYLVVIEETKDGYSAYAPDLPGCVSVGDTRSDVEEHIYEAILFHLEGLKEDEMNIPRPKSAALHLHIPNSA